MEFYSLTPDGLILETTRVLYGKVTVLARLPAPANSPTDHVFVGTDQYKYFTLSWDSLAGKVRTQRAYMDLSDPSSRESAEGTRCLIDPSGRFLTLETYEGIVCVVPIIQLPKTKRAKAVHAVSGRDALQVGELGEPTTTRIDELFVRSSAFLHVQAGSPRFAMLYEDSQKRVRLKVCELQYTPATGTTNAEAAFVGSENFTQELDLGASHLIPVPAPLG